MQHNWLENVIIIHLNLEFQTPPERQERIPDSKSPTSPPTSLSPTLNGIVCGRDHLKKIPTTPPQKSCLRFDLIVDV